MSHSRQKIDIPRDDLYQMLHVDGISIDDCAKHFGCSRRTIQKRMQIWGIQLRPQEYEFDNDELKRLYEDEGLPIREIAARFNCNHQTIYERLKDIAELRPNTKTSDHYRRNWEGGATRERDGYIFVRVAPGVEIAEHRHVMQQELGRDLEAWEHVHHMDRDRMNNDPSNLMVLTFPEHTALHAAMRRNANLDQRAWIMRYRIKNQPLQRAA